MMIITGIVYEALPFLLQGAVTTISLVVSALFFGFIIGLPLAIGQVYGCLWVKKIINIYVWFFRGLPVLVLLFLFYYGLFSITGLNISLFICSLINGLRSALTSHKYLG